MAGQAVQPADDKPQDYKALEQLLHARFAHFTPQQQRVAQRVLSDPEGCAFQTVSHLADAVGVNESTVVRFATSLGLDGYPELTRLCQQRLRERAQMVERFNTLSHLEQLDGGLLPRIVASPPNCCCGRPPGSPAPRPSSPR